MGVLRLQLPTIQMGKYCRKNIEEILTDHAWCEQKAATKCDYIITNNSEHQDLVQDLGL
jgi:tRNA-(ms[2]io[6]A)-hydroxylase